MYGLAEQRKISLEKLNTPKNKIVMSWLLLHRWIPHKDLRKHFYSRYLTGLDRLMVRAAHGCCREFHEEHLFWAIKEDHLEVFCWIYKKRRRRVHRWVITRAFQFCRLDVLDFLWRRGEIKGDKEIFEGLYFVAYKGDTEVLQWLVTRGIRPDPWCITIGAIHGERLDVLEFAALNGLWVQADRPLKMARFAKPK
jgi:hypothetical protein